MAKRSKYVLFGALGIAFIISLPVLVILMFATSNAIAAAYYVVFTSHPSSQDLIGTYQAKPTWGSAELILKRDGTFEESVAVAGGPPKTLSGHWSKYSADGGHAMAITFAPYINVQEDEPQNTYDSYTVNFYKKKYGTTFGVLNPDTGLQFLKPEN